MTRPVKHLSLLILFALVVVFSLQAPRAVLAADLVTNCTIYGPGPGTLQGVFTSSGNAIFMCSGTIVVPDIGITTTASLDANGYNVTLSGNNANRVFSVGPGASLTLKDITITGGNAGTGNGGGIFNNGGTVTITGGSISGNRAVDGGGIYNAGSLNVTNARIQDNAATGNGSGIASLGTNPGMTIVNTTISGNGSASTQAGALYIGAGTAAVLGSTIANNRAQTGAGVVVTGDITSAFMVNSTISGNTATGAGGGIYNNAILTLTNVTINANAGQTGGGVFANRSLSIGNSIIANSSGGDCASASGVAISAIGPNLVQDGTCGFGTLSGDPNLGPLANNGGPTFTHALPAGSPAINAADNGICALPPVNNVDQRGFSRPQGRACDLGAFEALLTTGDLRVTKTIQWNNFPVESNASFQICVSGPAPATTARGCRPFTPTSFTGTWGDLPSGDYTVTEVNPGSAWQIVSGDTQVVTVQVGEITRAEVINRRVPNQSVTVELACVIDNFDGSFRARFNYQNNNPVAVTLPIGPVNFFTPAPENRGQPTVFLTGQHPNAFETTFTPTAALPALIWTVIGPNGAPDVAAASASSTRCPDQPPPPPGSLSVSKTIDWNGFTPFSATFEVCITGPSYPTTPNCRSFSATSPATWSGLTPGGYIVTETAPLNDWQIVSGSGQTVTVVSQQTATATITNRYTPRAGSLSVSKTIDWNGFTLFAASFQVCITGPSHPGGNCQPLSSGTPAAWSGLTPGSYTVTETNPGMDWEIVSGSGQSVTVPPGMTAEHVIANRFTPQPGSLNVFKLVDWNGNDPVTATFEACITGPSYPTPDCQTFFDGSPAAWDNLIPGSYTVTETNPGPDWEIVSGSGQTVSVASRQTASVTISNRYTPQVTPTGSLSVSKVIDWNGADPFGAAFEACITGPLYPSGSCQPFSEGSPATWDNLTPGDYTVTETDPGPDWTVVSGSGQTVSVASRQTASATITNQYAAPSSGCPVFEGFPVTRIWWPDGDNQDVIRLVSGGPVTYQVEGFFTNPDGPAYAQDGQTGVLNDGDELVLTYPPIGQWGSPNPHGAYEAHVKVHFVSACGYVGTDWDRWYHDADQDGIVNDLDCAPNDPTRGGPEIPDDGLDQDCSGADLVIAPPPPVNPPAPPNP